MFKDKKNHKKHMDRYYKGAINQTMKGKKQKEYVCIGCGDTYVNQRRLVNHMIVCRGDMCLQAPYNISNQETDESCGEIEVCEIPTPPHSNPPPCRES